jgi:hypothetical protein
MYNSFKHYGDLEKTAAALGIESHRVEYSDSQKIKDNLFNILSEANQSVFIWAGEMRMLEELGKSAEFRDWLETRNENFVFELVCGRWLFTAVEDAAHEIPVLNAFLRTLYDMFKDGKLKFKPVVLFNDINTLDQVRYGFIHGIVVDGRHAYLEEPHGYLQEGDNVPFNWLFVKDSADFAREVTLTCDIYKGAVRLREDNFEATIHAIAAKTRKEADFYAERKGKGFRSEKKYFNLLKKGWRFTA